VVLRSQTRKGLLATAEVACDRRAVTAAAGACAEHLRGKYGDLVDPDRVAMTAEQGFDGFLAAMNRGEIGYVES
jgi:hypothetical protein